MQARITTELQGRFSHWQLRLPPLPDAWHRWLQGFRRRELSGVSGAGHPQFCAPLKQAHTHLTNMLRALHDRLLAPVRAAPALTLQSRGFVVELREPDAPPVDVSCSFDVAFYTLGWPAPERLLRSSIQQTLLRKPSEIEKHRSRLASDRANRVGLALESTCRQAEALAREELETLERISSHSQSDVPRLRLRIAELELTRVA